MSNPAYSIHPGRRVWLLLDGQAFAGKVAQPGINARSRMVTQVYVPARQELVQVDDHRQLTGRV